MRATGALCRASLSDKKPQRHQRPARQHRDSPCHAEDSEHIIAHSNGLAGGPLIHAADIGAFIPKIKFSINPGEPRENLITTLRAARKGSQSRQPPTPARSARKARSRTRRRVEQEVAKAPAACPSPTSHSEKTTHSRKIARTESKPYEKYPPWRGRRDIGRGLSGRRVDGGGRIWPGLTAC